MIGARFDFQCLLKQLNSFGGVALVQLEYSLVVEGVDVARHGRRAPKPLFTDREIGADSGNNLSLISKLREQPLESRLCAREVVTVELSQCLLERSHGR